MDIFLSVNTMRPQSYPQHGLLWDEKLPTGFSRSVLFLELGYSVDECEQGDNREEVVRAENGF